MQKIDKKLIKEVEEYAEEYDFYTAFDNATLIEGLQSTAYMLRMDGLDRETLIDAMYTILLLMGKVKEE